MSKKIEQQLINDFGKAQMKKLDLRSDKGRLDWREKDISDLWYWLSDEVLALREELRRRPQIPEKMKDEAVDVANLAMFIYDKINQDD